MSSESNTPIDSDRFGESPETNPVLETARTKCQDAIEYGFEQPYPVLVDALPAMGKSSGVIRWAESTGTPLTVLTERHDLYGQYIEWCEEQGLSVRRLPAFHRDCPTMAATGERKRLQEEMSALYRAGISGKAMHTNSAEYLGQNLPCQHEGECPYIAGLSFDPQNVDVLVGHYRHARVERYVQDRYVVFDEFPGDSLLETYTSDITAPAVTCFLEASDGLPFNTYTDLIEYRHNPEHKTKSIEWFRKHNPTLARDIDSVRERGQTADVMGPLLTYALLVGVNLGNGWEYSDLGSGRATARNRRTDTLTVFRRPTLSDATSVLALDGTPTVEKWEMVLGSELEHYPVLDSTERRQYVRKGLGLTIVQTTENLKPYNSGEYVSVPSDRVLFDAIGRQEGQNPSLISSKRAIEQYDRAGALTAIDNSQHYGNLKGSNEFEYVRLGIVAGSVENGSDEIELWGALAGIPIEDNNGKGMERSYGEFGDAILRGMRENEVLQAVMRFGRKEKDGERGATVYVHTGALPDWVPVTRRPVEIHLWESEVDGMKQVLTAIEDFGEWQTSDVANHLSVTLSQQQVRRNLKTLRDYGYIAGENEGPGIGYRWQDIRASEASPHGHVEFA